MHGELLAGSVGVCGCFPGYSGADCSSLCSVRQCGPDCSLRCPEECENDCDHETCTCEVIFKYLQGWGGGGGGGVGALQKTIKNKKNFQPSNL